MARSSLAPHTIHVTAQCSRQTLLQSTACSRRFSTLSTLRSQQSGKKQFPVSAIVLVTGCTIGLLYESYYSATIASNDAPKFEERTTELPTEGQDIQIWKGMFHPALDLAAATSKLKAEETSTRFLTVQDTCATRFDSVRVASNYPSEDERSYAVANVGDSEDWKFWGVYDGHA